MARIRTVKPEFWTDAKIVELPFEARLLFIGMWNFADDEGCLPDEPATIRLQVLPADPVDTAELLRCLELAGLIDRWLTAAGRPFLRIKHFDDHQRVQHPVASKLLPGARRAEPANIDVSPVLMSPHEDSGALTPEGKGMEGNIEKTASSLYVQRVFDVWIEATGRTGQTKLDAKRRRVIEKALDSHGLDDCLAAVRNIGADGWARGNNERGRRYDDIKHALGDAERIERWRDAVPRSSPADVRQARREGGAKVLRLLTGQEAGG